MTDIDGGQTNETSTSIIGNNSSVNGTVWDIAVDGFSESNNGTGTSWIEWDDWDQSLWTPEQRHLLEQGAIPRHVHISLGVLLTLVVLFGVIANATILYVFSRYVV